MGKTEDELSSSQGRYSPNCGQARSPLLGSDDNIMHSEVEIKAAEDSAIGVLMRLLCHSSQWPSSSDFTRECIGELSPLARHPDAIPILPKHLISLTKVITAINRLTAEMDMNEAMASTRAVTIELLDCERVSVFLVEQGRKELVGYPQEEDAPLIRIPFGSGIAGHVAQTGRLLNITDAYACKLFNPEADRLTGFTTRSILCCPIPDSTGRHVAVLQVLNKRSDNGCFSKLDELHLQLFAAHLGNVLVKSLLLSCSMRLSVQVAQLHHCMTACHSARSLPQLVRQLRVSIQKLLSSQLTFVFLMDATRGDLWTTLPDGAPCEWATLCALPESAYSDGSGPGMRSVLRIPVADVQTAPGALSGSMVRSLDRQRIIAAASATRSLDLGRTGSGMPLSPLKRNALDAAPSQRVAGAPHPGLLDPRAQLQEDIQTFFCSPMPATVMEDEELPQLDLDQVGNPVVDAVESRKTRAYKIRGNASSCLSTFSGESIADRQIPLLRDALGLPDNVSLDSCILEPVVARDRCIAVLIVVNKVSARRDILQTPLFSRADCQILSLLALEAAEVLTPRAAEISFASALTMASNQQREELDHGMAQLTVSMLKAQLAEADEYNWLSREQSQTLSPAESVLSGSLTRATTISTPAEVPLHSSASRKQLAITPVTQQTLRSWDLDMVSMCPDELCKLAYDIFADNANLLTEYLISRAALLAFLGEVQSHYRQQNPYHNWLHAVHVLQAVHTLLHTTQAHALLTPLEQLSLLVAAICHDAEHDGLTNGFHVHSQTELAQQYNDTSVLENHHCAVTWAVLQKPTCAIFAHLPKDTRQMFRKNIIGLIMATDMMHHLPMLRDFDFSNREFSQANPADRWSLAKMILHTADLSNCLRPPAMHRHWVERVHREFNLQADRERALAMPITPYMDARDEKSRAKVEADFMQYMMEPLLSQLMVVLQGLDDCMDRLRSNHRNCFMVYQQHADTPQDCGDKDVTSKQAGGDAPQAEEGSC